MSVTDDSVFNTAYSTPSNFEHQHAGTQIEPEEARYYDAHTLKVESECTQVQFERSLRKFLLDCDKIQKDLSRTKYVVNFFTNKEGKSFGYGFVWLESTEVYNLLLMLNPDGSPREERAVDPNWEAQEPESSSWADIIDAETPDYIVTKLDPLVSFPDIHDDFGNVLDYKISKASCRLPEGKSHKCLFSKNIPKEITEEDLWQYLKMFSTSNRHVPQAQVSDSEFITVVKGRNGRNRKKIKDEGNCRGSYPLVTLNPRTSCAKIEYDPSTKDALFVYKIARKFYLTKNGRKYMIFLGQANA